MKEHQFLFRTGHVLFLFLLIVFFSGDVFPDTSTAARYLGPRFEIGLGGSVSRVQSRPEWSSKHFLAGTLTCSYRVVRGLSIQAGKNLHYGSPPRDEWIPYSPHIQLKSEPGTAHDDVWLGARYDIPMSVLRKDILGIHTICISGGVIRDTFKIRSKQQRYFTTENGWETGETPELRSESRTFEMTDLDAYYAALAARWRVDTIYTEEEGSWIGAYGIDLGVRYTRYTDCSTRNSVIMEAGSNFNTIQVFIVGFIKLKLFY